MRVADWRYYIITDDDGRVQRIYAPDLDRAFSLARLEWGSRTLHCNGTEAA